MARQSLLALLYCVASALAKGRHFPRQVLASCSNEAASEGTACLSFNTAVASSFCSNALTVPTKTQTITETSVVSVTETSFSPVITELGTPPVTTTITGLTTFNSIVIANRTIVLSSGTSVVASATITLTDSVTAYTCGLPSAFTNTPAPITFAAQITTTRNLARPIRIAAATTTPSFDLPQCYTSFVSQHGQDGITSACACYGFDILGRTFTSTTTTTSTSFSTSTSTLITPSTLTITPTNTATLFNTTYLTQTSTSLTTSLTPLYPNATTTLTTRITQTLTTASPRPTSAFHLYYTIPGLPSYPPQYAHAINTTDNSGVVLSFTPLSTLADSFALDPQLRLIDQTSPNPNDFAAKNPQDVYPWFFLDDVADVADTPLCYTCSPGEFHCAYPGGGEQVWAVCDGFLALGPGSAFVGSRDCVVVEVGFEVV